MQQKMKLILCFSPVGDNFRIKARKFPGLINATSIDWFHPWPKDALIDVSSRFIADVEFPEEDLLAKIALNMATVHSSIDDANVLFLKEARRHNYTTPKSFLELISFYKNILSVKRGNIEMNIQRFDQGLMILA
jgi:dynein heavy chain